MTRLLAFLTLALLACGQPVEDLPPNILFVLLDDLGVDKVGVYQPGAPTLTPQIDALAQEGLVFDNAYADPFCSPTRAGLLTGLHAYHYGIGTWLRPGLRMELPDALPTVADLLLEAPTPYQTSAVGKWHLGGSPADPGGWEHPRRMGFQHYAGAMDNLWPRRKPGGQPESYFHYTKVLDGKSRIQNAYITSDEIDDALAAIDEMTEPWFLWLATHAAHTPLAPPPEPLNFLGVTDESTDLELFHATVLAVDAEVGRLLAGMDPEIRTRTTIIVMGDNGTSREWKMGEHRSREGKATLYQGGIHVPLVVAGAGVVEPGRRVPAMVSHVDLLATVAELARVPTVPRTQSISFASQLSDPEAPSARESIFAEVFSPIGPPPYKRHDRVVVAHGWKLIRFTDGREELYQLETDPREEHDLLPEGLSGERLRAYDLLSARMSEHYLAGGGAGAPLLEE